MFDRQLGAAPQRVLHATADTLRAWPSAIGMGLLNMEGGMLPYQFDLGAPEGSEARQKAVSRMFDPQRMGGDFLRGTSFGLVGREAGELVPFVHLRRPPTGEMSGLMKTYPLGHPARTYRWPGAGQ